MRPVAKVRKFKMSPRFEHKRSEGLRGGRGLPPDWKVHRKARREQKAWSGESV